MKEGDHRKILIVRLSSLGDIVHTIPAQQQIRGHLPKTEIHWLTQPPYDSLLRHTAGITRVWLADTRNWRKRINVLAEIGGLITSLRRQGFDLALDFQGLMKSALLARLSGACQVVGFAPNRFTEPGAAWFYSTKVPGENGGRRHVIEVNLELARLLGCSEAANPLIPLRIPQEAAQYVKTQLSRLGIDHPILISPGAGWETKLWKAENYAHLCSEIHHRLGLPVVLNYGPGEENLIEQVRAAAAPAPIDTFSTDILELAALCQQSRLLIGGDTGPLHLAVALGTPTVAIMGPTSPWRNGPFNPDDKVLKRDSSGPDSYKRTGDQLTCTDIPVRDVFDAVVQRLKT